jgi:integrase
MATVLNNQSVEAFVNRARSTKGKQIELIDNRESGLRIRAGERGATWLLCVRLRNGKRTRVKLGSWPGMTIANARKMAQDQKNEVVKGLDPNAAKRQALEAAAQIAASRRSLLEVLNQYERVKLVQLRRGAAVRRALDGRRGLLRAMVNREPASITRSELAQAVRDHAATAPIAANRSLAYAKAFFNWCVDEEIIETNPAARVKRPAKERQRDRYHTLVELSEIWQATLKLGYPFGPLYRLLIILPMRRDEVAAMPLAELDLGSDSDAANAVWTLPAARTKLANALRVPLSPLARSIILEAFADPARPSSSPYIFSMTGDTPVSGFAKAKRRLDGAIEQSRAAMAHQAGLLISPMQHWTVHDLRTTFNTHACELLGVDIAVADRILNHMASATTSKVMRVYNKSELFEPRKVALCNWAALIETKCIRRQESAF